MREIIVSIDISPNPDNLVIYKGILVFSKDNKFRGFVDYVEMRDNKHYKLKLVYGDYHIIREFPTLSQLIIYESKYYNFKQLD